MKDWSNLAKIVYKRTYSRNDTGIYENWPDTVSRVLKGNKIENIVEFTKVQSLMLDRKAMPAGRGLWFSGAPAHEKIGGAALNNCWFTTACELENFVMAQDLLMLGGGVGLSVEHKYVSKLPKIRKDVKIIHKASKDADFIVPDSREGWNELTRRALTSFFIDGKSFSYSTVCIRGHGEVIRGFGGKASGPQPFIDFIEKISLIFQNREGKHLRPIDASDIVCAIGEFVVAGNIRRSAIIILGDPWDKDYLRAKRWDLGILPSYRAMANFSIVVDDIEDVHPLFWKTYESGEPFGIFNRKNAQIYGRMGEKKKDTAEGLNPCAESTLEDGEPCNLQELFLPNFKNEDEFVDAAVLMHRYGKRVTMEPYHNPKNDLVVKRNRRVGTGITGCLQSELFNKDSLDRAYQAIQIENKKYSKELGIPESIRTTLVKPSGTLSLIGDVTPGIHPSFSRHYIRRVRFAASDRLITVLKDAGHPIEATQKFDGTLDRNTLVVDFFCNTPEKTPCVDEGFTTWNQLDTFLLAQKYWSDQAVSVTVYYKKDEIPLLKIWLADNLKNLKSISFLCYNEHGFKQAPLESITKEQYEKAKESIKEINVDEIDNKEMVDSLECEGGVCPIK